MKSKSWLKRDDVMGASQRTISIACVRLRLSVTVCGANWMKPKRRVLPRSCERRRAMSLQRQ